MNDGNTICSNCDADVAIIGGGLAGLALSIQLAKKGYAVIVFEKEQYPFHKVCGEYISLESWDFITSLGLDLKNMNLPVMNKLLITAPNGRSFQTTLDLGGFGISRYKLDHELVKIARSAGVMVKEHSKINDISFTGDSFSVSETHQTFNAKVVCGSFGKRSNIDVKWNRPFINESKNKLNNFLSVKHHIKANLAADTISLHNFRDGYCGISKIEEDKHCLCYLTKISNLKEANGNIDQMEQTILAKNPALRKVMLNSKRLFEPIAISQVSFSKKQQVENHVLMIGDAAGMITPLCGNGMSMALHGSKIAFTQVDQFFRGYTTREGMEKNYSNEWKKQFASRLSAGRKIQSLFGKPWVTNLFVSAIKPLPRLADLLIRQTHGRSF